jgi:glutamate decarboxylase
LIHLGFNGYRQIMENCLSNARLLSKSLEATGWYTCVSDIHRKKGESSITQGLQESLLGKATHERETSADYNAGLPVVAFRFSNAFKAQFPHLHQVALSNLLRAKQYIVPNYPLPPMEEKTEILRVVVRQSMSLDLIDRLVADICAITQTLMDCEPAEVAFWQTKPGLVNVNTSAEKVWASAGGDGEKEKARDGERPMLSGVHRSVC